MRRFVVVVGIAAACLILALIGWKCAGCDQKIARSWGGALTVELPPNTALVNATWKEDELWYLVRPRRPDESPTVNEFIQRKPGALTLEGKVVFEER